MGIHRNGDSMPPEGDRPPDEPLGLPDLPALPDGVVIPDDPAALAAEAEAVREQLRRGQLDRQDQSAPDELPWFAGDGPVSRPEPSVGVPLMIMTFAVVITLVSMLAMVLSGPDPRAPERSSLPVPEVVLTDDAGRASNLASLPPVVIILVESCACDALIADTVRAAPPGVTVVAIGRTPPPRPDGLAAGAGGLRLLGDPEGEVRSALHLGAPPVGAATVVLADRAGIVRTTPATNTIESYADALPGLGGR
jgi:hypothetical protein